MNESLTIVKFLIFLALLWGLWYVLVRDLQKDIFRQKLFDLRDKLFDYAANGNIDFRHPTYIHLRQVFNRTIRFSDRIDVFSILFIMLWTKDIVWRKSDIDGYERKMDKLFNSIQKPEVKQEIQKLYFSYCKLLVLHLLETSLVFMLVVIIVLLIQLLLKIYEEGFKVVKGLNWNAVLSYLSRKQPYSTIVEYLAFSQVK